jgi:hypothetical protein
MSELSPAILQAMLDQARTARFRLVTGRLPIEVEADGRRSRFARMTLDDVEAEISRLENAVAGRTPRKGAIGFLF